MPRRAGNKLFSVLHHHLDRATAAQGEQIADRFVYGSTFAAEVAADGHGIDADSLRGNPESGGHTFFESVRHLVGRPHLHAILIVDPNQTTMRLEKCLMNARDCEGIFNDQIGSRESLGDVSASPNIANESVRRSLQGLGQSRHSCSRQDE